MNAPHGTGMVVATADIQNCEKKGALFQQNTSFNEMMLFYFEGLLLFCLKGLIKY